MEDFQNIKKWREADIWRVAVLWVMTYEVDSSQQATVASAAADI